MGESALTALHNRRSYADYLFAEAELRKDMFSQSLRLAVLRNYTVEMLLPVIRGELALLDTFCEVYLSDFDVILPTVIDKNSGFYKFQPAVICIMLDYRQLSPKLAYQFSSLSSDEVTEEKERILSYYNTLLNTIRQYSDAAIILSTLFSDGTPCMGLLDAQRDVSEVDTLAEINCEIHRLSACYTGTYLMDLHTVVYNIGWNNAFDAKAWHISKNPFSKIALLQVGKAYGQIFQVITGHIKKCIVLDCDNTLWGGIVGEVGCYGVTLGQDYPGNCYLSLQREILHLYHRGIMVALCSKNNREDVLEVFNNNREMLLSLKHIAAYEINWKPKSDNLRAIATKLNIGVDSLVFVDDSAFECEAVRRQLPDVAVIELTGDPASYAKLLRSSGLFNALSYTRDDAMRNKSYQAEARRNRLRENALSTEDYLASLNMSARIYINMPATVSRIAQMTQKTNQFNLTTHRYTEANIKAFMEDKNTDVLAISLKDKISDLGIIGAMIIRYANRTAEVDTLLLSCRALGRHAEDVLFFHGIEQAAKRGCAAVIGRYVPTKKNMQVADLYTRFGLGERVEDNDGSMRWNGTLPHISVPDYIMHTAEGE